MPYRIKGKSVQKKSNGWHKVGKSNKPKKYIKTLRAVEHGWRPTKSRKKGK